MMGGSTSCRWTRARSFGLTRQGSRSRVPRRWRAAKWWSAVTMATCIALARGSEMHGYMGCMSYIIYNSYMSCMSCMSCIGRTYGHREQRISDVRGLGGLQSSAGVSQGHVRREPEIAGVREVRAGQPDSPGCRLVDEEHRWRARPPSLSRPD